MKILCLLFLSSLAFNSKAQKQTHFSVNFAFNKFDITALAKTKLDSFINFIATTKTSFTIELAGHTDSVGSHEFNFALSLRRVDAVKKYLDVRGLESFNVVKQEALGKEKPLNKNQTEHDRFLNRRVELYITTPGRSVMRVGLPETKRGGDSLAIIRKSALDSPAKRSITAFLNDTTTKVGSRIVLKDLIFIGGRHHLVPSSIPVIQELLTVLNKHPSLVISIEGHVCCIPGTNDGIDLDLNTANLSEMRAKTVYDYLIRNGVAAKRLSYKGYGHQFPVRPYPEKSVEDMDANRRVEIKIISR